MQKLTGWQFASVIFLVFIFFYLLINKEPNKLYYIFIGISVLAIIFYSQKQESAKLISMENAKRIAKKSLENRKEEFEISADADITTGFCRLEMRMGEPYEWHIAVKIETPDKEKQNWRVDIAPYIGGVGVTGIVKEKYDGTTTIEKVYVQPEFFYKE